MTLIELLVGMVISLVIISATVTFLIVSFGQENDLVSRVTASNRAEAGFEQLVRDLREAITSVNIQSTATSVQITLYVPTPGNDATGEKVIWNCNQPTTTTAGSCTRALTSASGATTTSTQIWGVQSWTLTPVPSVSGDTLSTYPVYPSSVPTLAALQMTLSVRVTNYGLTNLPTATAILRAANSTPIMLQATADLRNFG